MDIFDKALGVHPYSLQLRLDRAAIITSNLANVDTPGFKSRDIDYKQVMHDISRQIETAGNENAIRNQLKAGQSSETVSVGYDLNVGYRVPYQPSADGNTVDLNVEQANFAANSMDFQTAITFLNMKINGLHKAIKGE